MADATPEPIEVVSNLQSGWTFLRVPWEFAVHAIVGGLIFTIIAAFAVVLDVSIYWLETYRIRWLEAYRVSIFVLDGLKLAAYALFITDLLLFLVFLWRTFKRTIKEL